MNLQEDGYPGKTDFATFSRFFRTLTLCPACLPLLLWDSPRARAFTDLGVFTFFASPLPTQKQHRQIISVQRIAKVYTAPETMCRYI